MCLLVFMEEGRTATRDALEQASWYNDDGFGWAIHAGNRIIVGKSMEFDKAYDEFIAARKDHQGPALFHLRITTQGTTDLSNCHPFQVGSDQLSYVAHNGMLPIKQDVNDKRSDTRVFAETLLPKRGGITLLNSEKQELKLSQWAAGSKLVFLTANPASKWRYVIINSDLGHWGDGDNEGVWFSSSSYKYSKPSFRSGMYTGWDDYRYGTTTYVTGAKTHTTVVKPTPSVPKDALNEWFEQNMSYHAYNLAEAMLKTPDLDGDPIFTEEDFYDMAMEWERRFIDIYEPYDDGTYMCKCPSCGGVMYLDELDTPATHCAFCDHCLMCRSEPTDGEDCCGWGALAPFSYDPRLVELEPNYQGGDVTDAQNLASAEKF